MAVSITHITVHPDGAIVERAGRIQLVDGEGVVPDLPFLLDESSLRLEVESGELQQVSVELDVSGLSRPDEAEALVELRKSELELRLLAAAHEVLGEQLEALENLSPWGPEDATPEADPPTPEALAAWTEVEEAVQPWLDEICERRRILARDIQTAEEKVRLARDAVANLSSAAFWKRWRPTRLARIRVDGPAEVDVRLSYRVNGARWAPAYTLHVEPGFRAARLDVRALVIQATAEDWAGVTLGLSTSKCRRRVELPRLPSLKLGTAQPPARPAWRPLPEGFESLFPPESQPPPRPKPAPSVPAEEPVTLGGAVPAASPASVMAGSSTLSSQDRKPKRRSGRRSSKSANAAAPPPSPPPQPGTVDVAQGHLDYPRLRLGIYELPVGQRGRLRRMDVADETSELGLEAAALAQLVQVGEKMRKQSRKVHRRKLPPHHTLPGPVEGMNFTMRTTTPVDVPADGRFHNVAVRTVGLSPNTRYRTVPHLDPRVFRRVRAKADEDCPFLPGPIQVFLNGDLLLETHFAGAAKGAVLELGLGVEDGIRLARNVRYREEKAGLFGGNRRLHTEIEVDLANSLAVPVEIELLSRIPVMLDEGATFELVQTFPDAIPWEGEPDGPKLKGAVYQLQTVAAGEQERVSIHYSMTLDTKTELHGGDRRG